MFKTFQIKENFEAKHKKYGIHYEKIRTFIVTPLLQNETLLIAATQNGYEKISIRHKTYLTFA